MNYYKHNKKEPTIINYKCDNFNKKYFRNRYVSRNI